MLDKTKKIKIRIQFRGDYIYLSKSKSVLINEFIDSSCFNVIQRFKNEYGSEFYLSGLMLKYLEQEKKRYIRWIKVASGEHSLYQEQEEIAKELERLYESGGKIVITNKGGVSSKEDSELMKRLDEKEKRKESEIEKLKDEFSVPIKKMKFENGSISFEKWINDKLGYITFRVMNSHIRKEYDAVKNYFAKVLGKRKLEFQTETVLQDDSVLGKTAFSDDVNKIDEKFIYQVSTKCLEEMRKRKDETGKVLFTMEEYFNAFLEENFDLRTFFENEEAFIEGLIDISNTKHYNQLGFLSSKHVKDVMELRFVQNPFAFLFLLEGEERYHFVWETLDTEEATYLWHIEKKQSALKQEFEKLTSVLKLIKEEGRQNYINKEIENFSRIVHDYSNDEIGFKKWKSKILEICN